MPEMEATSKDLESLDEMEWVSVRSNLYDTKVETFKEKLVRKFTENPVVPIGALATVSALSFGLWSSFKGNRSMSQYMMRTRVAAQGFTIFAMVAGFVIMTRQDTH